MSDWVFVHGLRARSIIGVYAWERRMRQSLVLDLDMQLDLRAAGASDELRQTVDYASVSDCVLGFVENARYELLESLAEALASLLLAEFAMTRLKLRISKPGAVAQADTVGVLIERPLPLQAEA